VAHTTSFWNSGCPYYSLLYIFIGINTWPAAASLYINEWTLFTTSWVWLCSVLLPGFDWIGGISVFLIRYCPKRYTAIKKKKTARGKSKQYLLITAILLPQCLSCYWDKIVSLRMLTNLRLANFRLTTAQQRTTVQNLPSLLYREVLYELCCNFQYQPAMHSLTTEIVSSDISYPLVEPLSFFTRIEVCRRVVTLETKAVWVWMKFSNKFCVTPHYVLLELLNPGGRDCSNLHYSQEDWYIQTKWSESAGLWYIIITTCFWTLSIFLLLFEAPYVFLLKASFQRLDSVPVFR
jgi:hypothetical protein